MTASVYLNGRFLSQPVTGVQRFAIEITSAIDGLMAQGQWPRAELLVPARGAAAPAPFSRLRQRRTGRLSGHLWEQAELPGAARDGILVSLGNTAPVLGGRRQVVVIHDAGVFDTPESYSFRFRALYKTMQRALARTGVAIATVSSFSRARIADRLAIDPAAITVVYEGADHILRAAPDASVLRQHGLRPAEFALVVGTRVAHKNLFALRDATRMLTRRGMTVALAGGSNAEVFQDVADDDGGLRRLGRVSDAALRAVYENAACLLFPSRYEGFGLPPVEAMACLCPVLAARGGAVEEICQNAALYFDNADPRSIVDALERLLDEPGTADDLRARGHARAAALRWDHSARALGDVVARLQ
jgi:glycosyltransferase involved in cell wall biosynthesis